ncbi:MAG: hypothetical protein U5N58_00085 [Actinomycetota bacterium]|nr:hypothetical protein [Actinomycetota bacterium]
MENGGSVHSIDKISAGASMVDEVLTSQDQVAPDLLPHKYYIR